MRDTTDVVPAGCPSPVEIAEHCRLIRSTWSMAEHYRRAGRRVPARFASSADENMGRVQGVSVAARLGDGMGEPAG